MYYFVFYYYYYKRIVCRPVPAVATGEVKNVLLVVVQQTHTALANVVDTHAQAQELGLGPNVATETDAFRDILRVEGRDGRVVGHLKGRDVKKKKKTRVTWMQQHYY